MKNSKRILSLVLSAGLLLSGCGSTDVQEEVTSSAVLVDVAEAKTGELTLSNQFVGVISPQESVYVVPLAQGTVKKTFFEVGDDVVEQFAAARFPIDAIMQRNETTGNAHIDLWEANVIVLEEVGVRREAVALSHRCTRCNPMRYFSARRIGIASGRNFTALLRLR